MGYLGVIIEFGIFCLLLTPEKTKHKPKPCRYSGSTKEPQTSPRRSLGSQMTGEPVHVSIIIKARPVGPWVASSSIVSSVLQQDYDHGYGTSQTLSPKTCTALWGFSGARFGLCGRSYGMSL